MPIQIWDRDGDFLGALQQWHTFTTEHFLSEAGVMDIEAPYSTWRALIAKDMRQALVEVTGPAGERVMRGRWTGRGDEPEAPAGMVGSCADLLEELRLPCIPPEYYVTHHLVLDALAAVLAMSGTDWALGDVSLAADNTVSANLAGMSCLEAFIELCEQSGNYFRTDGWNRLLDVFTDPFPGVVAYLVCANPDDALPPGRGRVETLRPDVDSADVLMAVWPEGGNYQTADDEDEVLRPTGEETLPAGFSFDSIGGQIAVANDAVEQGLVRVADFRRIQALSNVNLSASGFVESSSPGVITSEALRRPNDDVWSGGTLEISESEFPVGGHSGATIVGTWTQAFARRTLFNVRKAFPENAQALGEARQDLVNAACGLLRERQSDALEIEAGVVGLGGGLVRPGDTVRLECLGHIETHDALTGETARYIWDEFRGDLVVVSVTTESWGTKLRHTFSLSDRLRLLPTTTGLREMRSLAPPPRTRP